MDVCHAQPVFLLELCSCGEARCSSAAVGSTEGAALAGAACHPAANKPVPLAGEL